MSSSFVYDNEGQRRFVYPSTLRHLDPPRFPQRGTHVLVEQGATHFKMVRGRLFWAIHGLQHQAKISKTVLRSVDVSALFACKTLATLEIEEGSRLEVIQDSAFYWCTSLTEISVPASLREMGPMAFFGCPSLTKCLLGGGSHLGQIGSSCFMNCNALKEINLEVCAHLVYIPERAFKECSSLTKVVLPPRVRGIGYEAFMACSSLSAIFLPASLKIVSRSAFNDCKALGTIEFGSFATIDVLMNAGANADHFDHFGRGCTNLHAITWPPRRKEESPSIPPALWPQLLFSLYVGSDGILGSSTNLFKNRLSCTFSLLCSIQEELVANQVESAWFRGRRIADENIGQDVSHKKQRIDYS